MNKTFPSLMLLLISNTAVAELTEQAPVWIPKHFPEMLPIKAGDFMMGCVTKRDEVEAGCQSDEKPAHKVTLKSFEVSKTEITVGQFRVFIKQTGYKTSAEKGKGCYLYKNNKWDKVKNANWDKPNFKQTEEHPVTCVSWDDSQAYIKWLNSQVNTKALGKYRLLTEAEWEYAARGGETEQAYPWGNKAHHDWANYGKDSCCSPLKSGKDQWDYTAPVARFPANGFGLHDMHGNVWEWVQDKYQDNYKKALSNQ